MNMDLTSASTGSAGEGPPVLPAAALLAAAFAVPAGASADTQSVSIEQSAFTPPQIAALGRRHRELAQRQPARPHRDHRRRQLRLAEPHRARRLLLGVVRPRRRLSLLLHDPPGDEGRGRRLPGAAGGPAPRRVARRPHPADRPGRGGHEHGVDRARLRSWLRPGGDPSGGRHGDVQGQRAGHHHGGLPGRGRRRRKPDGAGGGGRPPDPARQGARARARACVPARPRRLPWCCRSGCASASAGSRWRSASSTATRTPCSPYATRAGAREPCSCCPTATRRWR